MTKQLERDIWIFGNPDKTKYGFATPGDLENYLRSEVFTAENGRYRQTLIRDADLIVLSREGLAFGHFEIEGRVPPNDVDEQAYPKVKQTYLVRTSTLYSNPVRLSDHSIKGLSYGYRMTEEQFEKLQQAAGPTRQYKSCVELPETTVELERVLREVKKRLGQGEFREKLLSAYGGKCAISNCEVAETLEAAHIDPWCNSESQDATNGLLLRADLHTLFDRDLIGIQPGSMTVHIAKTIRESEYGAFHGNDLNTPSGANALPNSDALERRWSAFVERHGAE